jgi:cytochrome c oxidase subunit 4
MSQSSSNQRTNKLHKEIQMKQEFRQHTVSFIMMILLTGLAFISIASDAVSDQLAIIFILVLASVQVFFQLYIWMHLGHKGHEFPKWGIIGGGFVALLTVLTLVALIW